MKLYDKEKITTQDHIKKLERFSPKQKNDKTSREHKYWLMIYGERIDSIHSIQWQ